MLPQIAGVTLLAAGAAGVAFYHLRHPGLAVLVLLAPLPGLAPALLLAPFWTMTAAKFAALAYLMAVSVGLLLAGEFALLVCDGAGTRSATHTALRRRGLALGSLVAAVAAAMLLAALYGGMTQFAVTAAALTAGANFSAVAGFYGARFLPCSEAFVTRHNRAHERWHRFLDVLIAVARPRWGFSAAGIALVLAALGFFAAQRLIVPENAAIIVFPAMGLTALAALSVAIRDWRAILSAALTLPLPVLLGLWALARLAVPLDAENLLWLIFAVAIGAAPLFVAGAEAGRYGRAGDDATIAAGRVLLRLGPGLAFAALVPCLALLLGMPPLGDTRWWLAIVSMAAGAGSLVFRPAFGIVIETWFPRPSTIAARYHL